jgi:hypothetical protein
VTTAASPIQAALATTITGDTTLAALLAGEKVYSQATLPADPAVSYIVLGMVSEDESHQRFQGAGMASGVATLDVFAADQMRALAIYGELDRLLHRTRLTLAGVTMRRGRLALTTILPDPLGVHLVAKYATLSR